MIQRSQRGLKFVSPAFSTPCLSSGPVNRSDAWHITVALPAQKGCAQTISANVLKLGLLEDTSCSTLSRIKLALCVHRASSTIRLCVFCESISTKLEDVSPGTPVFLRYQNRLLAICVDIHPSFLASSSYVKGLANGCKRHLTETRRATLFELQSPKLR